MTSETETLSVVVAAAAPGYKSHLEAIRTMSVTRTFIRWVVLTAHVTED
jgi:hypothetical protein